MPIETMTIPVISTGHVTKEVGERLTAEGDKNPWVICGAYEYGWFLWIGEGSDEFSDPPMPQCLRDIRDYLMYKTDLAPGPGAWVRLDCDADLVVDLPAYDW